jgi:hypothetical protein
MTSSLDEVEQKAAALDLDEVRRQLRDIIIEQHEGKWVFKGPTKDNIPLAKGGIPLDSAAYEAHEDFVRSRVNWGIALTARERGITVEPKARGKKTSTPSITAASLEDLLG